MKVREVVVEQAELAFPRRYSVPLFAQLGLDQGIVYEQGARHRSQKRVCLPSFEQVCRITCLSNELFNGRPARALAAVADRERENWHNPIPRK